MSIFITIFILLCIAIFIYNTMIKRQKIAQEAWSGIEVQLKRRYDLIPSLVEVVKAYAIHEKSILEKITKLRSIAGSDTLSAKIHSELKLSDEIANLFLIVENYPTLKADKNFQDLHISLVETENYIQDARRYYNATVRNLNTFIQMFPINILAKIFGFKSMDFFNIKNPNEKENITISLS